MNNAKACKTQGLFVILIVKIMYNSLLTKIDEGYWIWLAHANVENVRDINGKVVKKKYKEFLIIPSKETKHSIRGKYNN